MGVGTVQPTANVHVVGTTGLLIEDGNTGNPITLHSYGTSQAALNLGNNNTLEADTDTLTLNSNRSLKFAARENRNMTFHVGGAEVGRFMADGRFGIGMAI